MTLWTDPKPHVVHEEPVYYTETIKTYDGEHPNLTSREPAGEDVIPESETAERDPVTAKLKIIVTPERRIPYWEFEEKGRRQETSQCPDCHVGLNSRGGDMICAFLPMMTSIRGDHPWDIVACGRRQA